jgi:hypothetical protein
MRLVWEALLMLRLCAQCLALGMDFLFAACKHNQGNLHFFSLGVRQRVVVMHIIVLKIDAAITSPLFISH